VTTALYLRQSKDTDGTGLAVARQRDECLKLLASKGWADAPVAEYVDNDTSASTGRVRPAYARMLADIAAGRVRAVVAWDLDRLHRRPVELESFIDLADRHKIALATVSGDVNLSTDQGRLVARIKGAVARGEVERKSARQKAANRQRRAMGQPPAGGLRAVGYLSDGTTVVPEEAEYIQQGYQLLLAGGSLRSIANRWNAAGFLTAHGGPWRSNTVRYTLRNPRYAGVVAHMEEEIGKGTWPPVVSEEVYRAARAILDDPGRRTATTTSRRFLLSGLARCHHCGETVVSNRSQNGNRTYSCRTSRSLARAAEPIDDFVTRVVLARLAQPDALDLIAARDERDVTALRVEAAALRVRLNELADSFADGVITRGQMERGTDRARTRLEIVEQELAAAGGVSVLEELVTAGNIGAVWEGLDLDRRRAVIDTLVTITLLPPGRGARVFRPETVEIGWRTS
jgi:site-specific DNA recombinase